MVKVRAQIDAVLIDDIKRLYPEFKGLTASGLFDLALRKLIDLKLKEFDRGQVDD